MATLDKFYRFIRPEVTNCPLPVIDQAIIDTAIDFCNRTGIWRAWSSVTTVVANQSLYPITVPTGAIVRQVEHVAVGQTAMSGTTDLFSSIYKPNWQDDTGRALQAIYDDASKSVQLVPKPSDGGENIRFLVSFVPTPDATTVPDIIYDRFCSGFSCGVKAMLQMQKQTWGDTGAATINGGLYTNAIDSALAYATKQGMRTPLRSKGVY